MSPINRKGRRLKLAQAPGIQVQSVDEGEDDGSERLQVPGYGTKFRIIALSEWNSLKTGKPVPLHESFNEENKFIARFDSDNVDFEIEVSNEDLNDRDAAVHFTVGDVGAERSYAFTVSKGTDLSLASLHSEMEPPRFHFEASASAASAVSSRIGAGDWIRSRAISQIEIEVHYSSPGFDILVEHPKAGKMFRMHGTESSTVEEIMELIEIDEGIPFEEQLLMFNKKQLKRASTLGQCGISEMGNLLRLFRTKGRRLKSKNSKGEVRESESVEGIPEEALLEGDTESPQSVIVTSESFRKASFIPDERIVVEKFTIEFRLANEHTSCIG